MNQEAAEAWALGGIGATKGVWNYYIKPTLTAERAWMAMGLGILAYEMVAPPGELLSEGADRALQLRPTATRAIIGMTALHLANILPARIDPFHQSISFIRKLVR